MGTVKAAATAKRPKKASAAPRARRPADDADDRFQVEQARRAIADPENQERVPWAQVKRDLGL